MLSARGMNGPALAVLAGLLVGPGAIAQEKPKDTAAKPGQTAGSTETKDAKKSARAAQAKDRRFPAGGTRDRGTQGRDLQLRRRDRYLTGDAGNSHGQGRQGQCGQGRRHRARPGRHGPGPGRGAQAGDRSPARQARMCSPTPIRSPPWGSTALLSAASHLSVVPTADLWITGLYGEAPYLHRLLEKIHVKPDFLTCGDYKSAAEIFMREGPSKEAEAMQNWLLDSLYDTLVKRIAVSRKVSPELVKAWIDSGPHSAEKGKDLGIVDAVEHRQDLEKRLKGQYGADVVFDRKYGSKAEPKLDTSSPFGILRFWGELLGASRTQESKKPAIGIVYVEGPITLGGETASMFQNRGCCQLVASQGAERRRGRRHDQGRCAARRFAGGLGPGQRDHS